MGAIVIMSALDADLVLRERSGYWCGSLLVSLLSMSSAGVDDRNGIALYLLVRWASLSSIANLICKLFSALGNDNPHIRSIYLTSGHMQVRRDTGSK